MLLICITLSLINALPLLVAYQEKHPANKISFISFVKQLTNPGSRDIAVRWFTVYLWMLHV